MGKIIRVITETVFFAGITAFAAKSNKAIVQLIYIIGSGVVSATVACLYEYVDTKGQSFLTWFKSQILYRNKDVYLSFAYSYKIEIDGKYLLIRGNRMKDRYQPIGGVYKYYREAKPALDELKCKPSTVMGNTDETDDLRLYISGKNVLKFIEWFSKMENREYDPTREFIEEVLETGILPKDKFQKIQYRKVGTHNVGFTYFVGAEGKKKERPEFIYADIFEMILSNEQKRIIKEAVDDKPDSICLASIDEIHSRRYNGSVTMNLGSNVPWIIGER